MDRNESTLRKAERDYIDSASEEDTRLGRMYLAYRRQMGRLERSETEDFGYVTETEALKEEIDKLEAKLAAKLRTITF